ncbi:MAG: hypothetical protein C4548_13215 [Desulfobacteraceae bacterium]|nr:MAG: hypothetical protein C4548_13215 [Desulfobacteraceae bacterium]
MSRREEKRKAYASMLAPNLGEPESAPGKKPEKVCGTCLHYLETSWSSDGRGSCKTLKLGSDIHANPPVYVTDGKEGYLTRTLSDASGCAQYEKMKLIDKDGYECSDPAYRRTIRQLQE